VQTREKHTGFGDVRGFRHLSDASNESCDSRQPGGSLVAQSQRGERPTRKNPVLRESLTCTSGRRTRPTDRPPSTALRDRGYCSISPANCSSAVVSISRLYSCSTATSSRSAASTSGTRRWTGVRKTPTRRSVSIPRPMRLAFTPSRNPVPIAGMSVDAGSFGLIVFRSDVEHLVFLWTVGSGTPERIVISWTVFVSVQSRDGLRERISRPRRHEQFVHQQREVQVGSREQSSVVGGVPFSKGVIRGSASVEMKPVSSSSS